MSFSDRFVSAWDMLRRHIGPSVRPSAVVLIALAALTIAAPAQDSTSGPQAHTSADGTLIPATGVKTSARKPFRAARLTYLVGDVRVEQANSTENGEAVINMPLVERTVISSGADGQAEIEFEDGSLARLTPNSGLSLVNLSVDSSGSFQTRIALLGGLAYFELRAGTKYIYRVDAGQDVISPVENSTIRINFDEPPAVIAVLDGTAHLVSANGSYTDATAGQTVGTDSVSSSGVYMVKQTIAPETWDQWNEDRDQTAANESNFQTDARTNFAGNQGYGWSDLDANGNWYDVPGHGKVWQPDIAAAPEQDAVDGDQSSASFADDSGFDPYGYGSWAWTPAGYSWASGYGWGWLPYRCGLWSYYPGFGWGWSPNPYCGVYGFAGFGFGYSYGYDGGLNFGSVPPRYKRPHRPIPGPGPLHPILRGHGGGGPVPVAPVHRPGSELGGERRIAGNTVHPLPPVGSGFTIRTGGALGSALSRDYPVDAKTHTPIIGMVVASRSTPAAGSNARAAWQPPASANAPSRSVYLPQRPSPAPVYEGGSRTLPAYDGSSRPAPVNRPMPAPLQRQSAPSTPRPSPPSAPASHASPAAPPSPSPKGK